MHKWLYSFLVSSVVILLYASVVLSTEDAYCFRYTWLGPTFNNESVFLNATCNEATHMADNVPCELPLVATYDGTWPDIDYLVRNHLENITCPLNQGFICAKYNYYFDGHILNSTSMCTRAVDTAGYVITSGCFESKRDIWSSRVCFCESVPGAIPCNAGTIPSLPKTAIYLLLLVALLIART